MNEFNLIESPLSGTNLIEASAGTGKTYAISIIFLRLIVENDFRIEDILVVTFTIPATMELRLRIRDRLKDALNAIENRSIEDSTVTLLMEKYRNDNVMKQRISAALKSFDQASVYTIHSFCQQMLADNAFESGSLFSSEIVNDDLLIKQGVADLCRRTLYKSSTALVSYFMNNCSAGELLELYKKRPMYPDLRIEPEITDAGNGSMEMCYNKVIELYNDLSGAWEREENNVNEILNRENFLDGHSYNKKLNDKNIGLMNDYISGKNPFALFDRFDNFTSGRIREKLKPGNAYPESEVFEICQKIYTAYNEYLESGSSILNSIKRKVFDEVDQLILDKKSIRSRRSFDDLIKDAYRGLNGSSGHILGERIRSRYRAALIDEFQDTDNLQFDIFSRLFGNDKTILFLIGDPKQAIYRFRGADIFSYIKASQAVKNRYTLAHNWRSRAELIEAVNRVFVRPVNPFIFEQINFNPVKPGDRNQGLLFLKNGKPVPPFDIWLAGEEAKPGNNKVIEKLSAEISILVNRDNDNPYTLGDKKINPGDIAVLVRTKLQGREVRDALSRYHIPSVSRGLDNVFKTEEAISLYFIVSAIADPSNYSLVKAAASTVTMGGSSEILYGFTLNPEGADGSLDAVTSRFYGYRETWISGGFLSMITGFLEGESVPARLFTLNGGERMMTNINHIAEILHAAENENGFIPKELVAWFADTLSSPPDDDGYSMRLERDDDAVNIVTMHACKGLEFPIVYCPFLAHSGNNRDKYVIFHDPADGNRPVLYLDKEIPGEIKEIKKNEDLAENVRLLYVAMTRAKSGCRVMFAPNTKFGTSAPYHIFVKVPGFDSAGFSRELIAAAFSDLAGSSDGKISFTEGAASAGKMYLAEKHPAGKISVRKFTGELKDRWKTHSYSAIVRNVSANDKTGEKDFQSEYQVKQEKGEGIFGFPSGARAGLCIHEIFERADFTLKDIVSVDSVCGEILEKFRYDISEKVHLSAMFFNVVNSVLDESSGLKLSDIDENSRLSELEFNFPMEYFDSVKFRNIFSDAGEICGKIYNSLTVDNSETGGMMKGFIDLVFTHKGKYYIADWKSNHLGNSYSDYSQEKITGEMERHNYFLQYYIYSVALNRYLKQRLGDAYSYEEHFGGIYYFFVRGMNPGAGSRTGIFRDRPFPDVIEKMDRFFAGENR